MNRSHKMFMVHSCVLCLVFAVMLGFDQIAAHSATWQAAPPLNAARDQFAGGVIDGKIYVFGGNRYPDGHNLKSTEMFDPATDKWIYMADNEHNGGWGVEEVSGAVVNGRFYVFGALGGGSPYGVFNFVEEYNPVTNTWTSKAPIPTTRAGTTAVVYNNKIYLFGGGYSNETGTKIRYDIVEAYDPDKNTWETVTHMPKTLWGGYAVAVVGDKAYVIGGVDASATQILNDVSAYDFITGTWTTIGFVSLPNPRVFTSYNSASPVVDGKIYLIGGIEGTSANYGPSSKVDIYDTVSNTWQTGTPLPIPTESHLSVVVKDEIYVVGGSILKDNDLHGETAAVWKCNISSIASSACTATLAENLSLHIPYLSYGNGVLSLWTDFAYEFNPTYPTLIPFKLTNYGILNNPSFSCSASTLSDDLTIHIPDVLLPDGTTHLWVNLEYSQALSIGGNFYWVVSNYGVISN